MVHHGMSYYLLEEAHSGLSLLCLGGHKASKFKAKEKLLINSIYKVEELHRFEDFDIYSDNDAE